MEPLSILLLALAILVAAIPVIFLAPILLAMVIVCILLTLASGVFLFLGLWYFISWPFKAIYRLLHD